MTLAEKLKKAKIGENVETFVKDCLHSSSLQFDKKISSLILLIFLVNSKGKNVEKIVKVCLHSSLGVQISLQFDEKNSQFRLDL